MRTYTVLVCALVLQRKIHKAMALLTKMLKDSVLPNHVTYTALIQVAALMEKRGLDSHDN